MVWPADGNVCKPISEQTMLKVVRNNFDIWHLQNKMIIKYHNFPNIRTLYQMYLRVPNNLMDRHNHLFCQFIPYPVFSATLPLTIYHYLADTYL
jgi:hypothetical protein